MNATTELEKVVTLLSSEPLETKITFREESAREIRYAVVVRTDDSILLRKLARFFGCPDQHLPSIRDKQFEAGDYWHGRGKVDLRALADELTAIKGEFFDFETTLAELRSLARIA